MFKKMRINWWVPVVLLLLGCGKGGANSSRTSYLQEGDQTCHSFAGGERAQMVKSLPQGFLTGYTGTQMDTAVDRVAGIPDRDLNHLVWTFQQSRLRGVYPTMLFPGVAGLTTLSFGTTKSGFSGMVATSITTGATQSGFALQHEIGHAVEIVAREAAQKSNYTDFDGALSQMESEFNSSGVAIRGYAKTSVDEGWAEAYANFYCSESSQNFIKTNLPKTFQFLSAVLAPAPWSTGTTTTVGDTSSTANATTTANHWVSDLVQYTTSKITPNLASLDFTKPIFSNLPEKNTSISMAFTEQPGDASTFVMVFATDPKITQIFICFSDEMTCSARSTLGVDDKAHTVVALNQIDGRNFFTPEYVSADQTKYFERGFLALGYDAGGALVGIRKLMIKKK